MNYIETLKKFEMVAARKIALTTERSYRTWIIPFLKFLPTAEARAQTTSEARIEVFLSGMAREDYSAVAQNQAFNAILFQECEAMASPLDRIVIPFRKTA